MSYASLRPFSHHCIAFVPQRLFVERVPIASRHCRASITAQRPASSRSPRMAPARTDITTFTSVNDGVVLPDLVAVKDAPESQQSDAATSGNNLFSLRDHTVLITGAGRGLGITLAAAVVGAGGHVACVDILPEPAVDDWSRLKLAAKRAGVTVSYEAGDITDETMMIRIVTETSQQGMSKGAPLRGAIACAGIQQKTPLLDYPATDFERIMKVNTVGTFITAKAVANDMIRNHETGSIVMIASMSGNIANRVC